MSVRVGWNGKAVRDLEGIRRHIASDSADAADRFVAKVISTAEGVSMPTAASIVPEFDDPRTREVFVGRYRVMFDLLEGGIEIIRVLHSARSLTAESIRRGD